MITRLAGAVIALALLAGPAHGADLTLGQRIEYTHVSRGHEFHVSGAAVAAQPDGRPLLAWAVEEDHVNQLYVLTPGDGAAPGRVWGPRTKSAARRGRARGRPRRSIRTRAS